MLLPDDVAQQELCWHYARARRIENDHVTNNHDEMTIVILVPKSPAAVKSSMLAIQGCFTGLYSVTTVPSLNVSFPWTKRYRPHLGSIFRHKAQ